MSKRILSYELTDLEKNVGNSYGGKVRAYKAKFDLAALNAAGISIKSGDYMKLCDKPHGAALVGVMAVSSAALTAGFTVNGQNLDASGQKVLAAGKYGSLAAGTPAQGESAAVYSVKADSPVWIAKAGANDQMDWVEEIGITPSADLAATGVIEFVVLVSIV